MANVCIYSLCVCLCVQFVFGQFGFFPPRSERRFPSFGFQNIFPPDRIRNTLHNILQIQPENPRSNPTYIYPFQNPKRPISNNEYDQNRPINNNEYDENRPINDNEYDQNRPINNNEYDENRPINDNEYDQNRPINNNEYDEIRPINNNEYDQNRPNNVRFPSQDDNPNGNVNFGPPPDPNPADEGRDGADGVNFGERPTFATINIANDESENKQGIPNIPPPGIPDTPPPGFHDTPPPGFHDTPPPGFHDTPPPGFSNAPPPGIPDSPPPGFPDDPPPEFPDAPPPATTLAPLTPVPPSEARDIDFGTTGIFKETCNTVDNGVGSCINIATCPVYLKLLKQATSNPQAVQVLRKAQCGFEGNYPKVCCPLQTLPSDPPPSPTPAPPPTPAPTEVASTESAASAKSLPTDDYIAKFPVPPECGFSNASFSRVVGGVNAKLGQFDWMALLGYKGRSGSPTRWLCGGSLISSRHVLTAAHCIHNHENDLFVVRLGELDIAREDDGATPIDVLIKSKIKHEGYNPKAFSNDIGLLVLEQEVQFTDLIKPICLPLDSELRARDFVDYNPFIAGWGDTEFRGPSATHLQVLQLPVVSNEFCAKAYSQYKAQVIDERVLCAGYKKGGKDACQGDSGGPLMQPIYYSQNLTSYFYQIGVVSYGKRCAEAGFPGVYSRVTHFMPWLQKHMLGTE